MTDLYSLYFFFVSLYPKKEQLWIQYLAESAQPGTYI